MNYILKLSSRKTISIKVTKNAELIVSAPKLMPKSMIEAFVVSKKSWIEKTQTKIREKIIAYPTPEYTNGSLHYFLGEKIALNIIEDTKYDVQFTNNCLNIYTKKTSADAIENLLYQWYTFQSKVIFKKELDDCFSLFSAYTIKKPIVKVRRMKTLWGNCRPHTGVVTLNTELILSPRTCIRYVIIHELCHLIQPNHSAKFYALQAKICPNWQECETLLKAEFSIRK